MTQIQCIGNVLASTARLLVAMLIASVVGGEAGAAANIMAAREAWRRDVAGGSQPDDRKLGV